jgi:hypothetical protein
MRDHSSMFANIFLCTIANDETVDDEIERIVSIRNIRDCHDRL